MLSCHLNPVYQLRDFFKKGKIHGICHLDSVALIRVTRRNPRGVVRKERRAIR